MRVVWDVVWGLTIKHCTAMKSWFQRVLCALCPADRPGCSQARVGRDGAVAAECMAAYMAAAHDVFFGKGTSQEWSILWTLPRRSDTTAAAAESTV